MKKTLAILTAVISITVLALAGCSGAPVAINSGDLAIEISQGEHWTHEMPVFLFVKIKSPPQLAIWVEDEAGSYIDTLYVTEKTAKQTWLKAPADSTPKDEIRRPESLPVWTARKESAGGLTPDSVTGATPKGSFTYAADTNLLPDRFYVYVEVNASLDFNEAYPEDAVPGAANYSGGEWGSGQPSLVYKTFVDTAQSDISLIMEIIGHGSPDGSSGNLFPSTNGFTTALSIVKDIIVKKK
jgi:hypothetical protein